MKKSIAIFSLALSVTLIVAGSASAVSYSMDYWAAIHSTFFSIQLEQASYESDFGLFAYEDPDLRIQVFDKNQEIGTFQNVYFKYDTAWEVSLDNTNWTSFVNNFGFYYGVYTGGANDSDVDYFWFTDTQYNQYADGTLVDTDIEHVRTSYDGIHTLIIELDDQLGGGDRDWTDMTIVGHDLHPVPEPASMLLLGSGMIGLAGVGRKKLFKK